MKQIGAGLLGVFLLAGTAIAVDKPVELTSEAEKLSYAMGFDLGIYFKGLDEEFNLDILHRGIVDAYQGREALLSEAELVVVQRNFAARQQERHIQQTVKMVAENRAAAEKFLAENRKKDGVQETKSGLQYKVIKKGEGIVPTLADTVTVHYIGTLIDGTEFDSSYKRSQPAVFQVGQVISGWQEALQLMAEGSIYRLYLPPDLAYGDRGAPPLIEPGSMLIFQVELVKVDKKEGEAGGQ